MLRKMMHGLIWIPLAVIFLVFAVANRHLVTVSFDPFNTSNPSVAITLPLFVVLILVAILGVIAGGTATWFGQRRWRRAARMFEADARAARGQLTDLRAARTLSPQTAPEAVAILRDKPSATL